jgi:hypothetical protein
MRKLRLIVSLFLLAVSLTSCRKNEKESSSLISPPVSYQPLALGSKNNISCRKDSVNILACAYVDDDSTKKVEYLCMVAEVFSSGNVISLFKEEKHYANNIAIKASFKRPESKFIVTVWGWGFVLGKDIERESQTRLYIGTTVLGRYVYPENSYAMVN